MPGNIRAEVGIGAPGDCPIAQSSADVETPINHVARSTTVTAESRVTEEFALEGETVGDGSSIEPVFESDARTVYQFDRKRGQGCVCECIEQYGSPVFDIHARDGTLFVSFHASDIDTVQNIVTDLHERFDEIQVRRLIRADEHTDHDFVLMDRSELTEKQRQVLKTSFEMGYFEYPKDANAGDVADALGIAPSTFSEHLAAAQRKILDTLLRT